MSQHVSQSGAAIFCGWVSVLISSGSPRVLRQLRARMGHARGVPNEIELAAANRSVFPTTLQVHGVCANRTGWGAGTVARRERTWGAQQWPPRWHAGRAPHLARAPATVPWRTGSGCPPRAGAGPFNSNPMGGRFHIVRSSERTPQRGVRVDELTKLKPTLIQKNTLSPTLFDTCRRMSEPPTIVWLPSLMRRQLPQPPRGSRACKVGCARAHRLRPTPALLTTRSATTLRTFPRATSTG